MDKEVTIVGKFYLRNGNVIDEKIIFDKDDNKEDIEKTIKDVRDMIKKGFREDYNIVVQLSRHKFNLFIMNRYM